MPSINEPTNEPADEPRPWNGLDEDPAGEDWGEDLDPHPDDPIPLEDVGLDFDEEEPEPVLGDFWPETVDDEI